MEDRKEQAIKRTLTGKVVSDKMDKTIVVESVRTYTHPQFKKIMHKTKKYKVHDENEEATIGDIVEFTEGNPKSKDKYMYLARIVERGSSASR